MRNNNSFYSIYCNLILITLSTIIILASSSLLISWSGSKAFLYMMTHGNTVLLCIIWFTIIVDRTPVKEMKTVTTNKINKFLKPLTVTILLITLLMIIIVSYASFFTSWVDSETFLDIVQQDDTDTILIWVIAYIIPFDNIIGKFPVQKD